MLIEIHMLKNYPPVNLNRDDSGAPKSCFFGGVQRGRISSQCLKRSWRTSDIFKSLNSYGCRTRRMPALVGDRLRAMGVAPEMVEVAEKKLTGIANKDGTENKKGLITSQIVFYSAAELDRITAVIKQYIDEDGDVEKFGERSAKAFEALKATAVEKPISADIALFGRMVTSKYLGDVDAAMQVAHAISTHAVNRESDYFTAVDDLMNKDEDPDDNGAGMIGDVDYNSCCYYEYASIDTDILAENLKNAEDPQGLMLQLIPTLIKAMAMANPSGKQNTFAGQVLPELVLVECKQDKIPLSYVNAFEVPVKTWGSQPNVVENSVIRLKDQVNLMDEAYELPVEHRAFFAPKYAEQKPEKCDAYAKFNELTKAVAGWL